MFCRNKRLPPKILKVSLLATIALSMPSSGCEYNPDDAKSELPAISHRNPRRRPGIRTMYRRTARARAYSDQDQVPDACALRIVDDIKKPLNTKNTTTA